MSRWEGFEEFVQVVNSGTFSAAARALGVSKGHVSQQVSRLEDRLGSRLLHRTTRKLSLTETGEIYYNRCQQIIEELEDAELSVNHLQQHVKGLLRISAPHLLGEVHLVPAIAEFLQTHPHLDVELDLTSRKVDLLEGYYDLAIQVGARRDVNVVNLSLAPTRFFVVASPEYLASAPPLTSPDDIKHHRSLLFMDRGLSKPWKFVQPNSNDTLQVRVSSHWRSNSGHALRAAAKQGLGLAYLPDYYLVEDIAEGRLVAQLQGWNAIDRDIVGIHQHKAHLSAKLRLFTEFLRTYFEREEHRLHIG